VRSELLSPIKPTPDDPPRVEQRIALCLSGGGYRAMLFHLGAIWRLNEAGYLKRLSRVSSVSGGSIVAARLGQCWGRLDFGGDGVAANLESELVGPVRNLAASTIDVPAVLVGLALPWTTISKRVAAAYKQLFGSATLQDLPSDEDGPRFVINATNLQSGVLWRFSRPFARDYKVGEIASPDISLAVAVAASSAFPPVLSPARLRFREDEYVEGSGESLQRPPFTTRPVLSDGGVYDNLGLQTAWNSAKTILISDGGGAMQADGGALGPLGWWRWRDWGSQSFRVLSVIDNQVRSLRKRQAISAFQVESDSPQHRDGTYWGIRSHIEDYKLEGPVDFPKKLGEDLAEVPTRLKALDARTQEQLIDWGYAICDTAMRRWVETSLPAPTRLPYPEAVG
jgi:NTE family protein